MDAETRQKVIALLQEGVSNELKAVIQYLWHHYLAEGLLSPSIGGIFEKFSLEEMKHLEKLSERIVALGGEPTTRLPAVKKGGDLRQMVEDDLDTEYDAIQLYKGHIKQLAELGDTTTRLMMEKTLSDEEEHIKQFEVLLSRIRKNKGL